MSSIMYNWLCDNVSTLVNILNLSNDYLTGFPEH